MKRIAVPKGEGDEIETPPWLFDYLNDIYCFTNDACCAPDNYKAMPIEDALKGEWGARNFMNPPYSKPGPFVARAVEMQRRGKLTVALLKGDPSVSWWVDWVAPYAQLTWIPFRVRFYYKGLPTEHVSNFPSVIAVYYPPLTQDINL